MGTTNSTPTAVYTDLSEIQLRTPRPKKKSTAPSSSSAKKLRIPVLFKGVEYAVPRDWFETNDTRELRTELCIDTDRPLSFYRFKDAFKSANETATTVINSWQRGQTCVIVVVPEEPIVSAAVAAAPTGHVDAERYLYTDTVHGITAVLCSNQLDTPGRSVLYYRNTQRTRAELLVDALMSVCKQIWGAHHGTHVHIPEKNQYIFVPRYANPVHACGRVFLDRQFERDVDLAPRPDTDMPPVEAHTVSELVMLMRVGLATQLAGHTTLSADCVPPVGTPRGDYKSAVPTMPPTTTTTTTTAMSIIVTPPPPPPQQQQQKQQTPAAVDTKVDTALFVPDLHTALSFEGVAGAMGTAFAPIAPLLPPPPTPRVATTLDLI